MQLKRIGILIGAVLFSTIFIFVGFSQSVYAANPGSILTGFNEALVTRDNTIINFGLFTTASDYDIKVYDSYLKGYAWGEKVGWISLNCANESTNNCADNDNFHVSNTTSGELSGWAWGQKTGWINFGPFANNSADTVVIDPSNGEFDGWAWAQKIGWIKFDCALGTACVKTDWEPNTITPPPPPPPPPLVDACPNVEGQQASVPEGYTFNGSLCIEIVQPTYVCSNGVDDDGDGLTDLSDSGCSSATDDDENNGEDPTEYACSDGFDNDGDGLADYPSDPGCIANNDNNEYNISDPQTCEVLGNCPTDEIPTCATNPSLCTNEPPNDGEPPDIEIPPNPTPEDVQPPRETFSETIGTGFRTITQEIRDSLNGFKNPFALLGDVTAAKIIGMLGILGALLAIPIPLWRSIFAFLYKNKRHPWGTVYDSITKQPLDPAYVILKDIGGKDVATAITDLDGRYGFLQSIGTYTIAANKTHYEFPSKRLAGKSRDELYDDLYFGEQFTIQSDGDVVMKNIPMDPIGFDWNQFAKQQQEKMKYYHRRDVILSRISNALFYIGFIFSVVALFAEVSLFNIVILALYVVLFVLRNTVFKHKAHGTIIDSATGLPISFAILRIHFASLGNEVAHAVTDSVGRYYKLIANGVYYVTVDKKNEDGTYTEVFKSEPMEVKNGVMNQPFIV